VSIASHPDSMQRAGPSSHRPHGTTRVSRTSGTRGCARTRARSTDPCGRAS
jgi:hypothetical protein